MAVDKNEEFYLQSHLLTFMYPDAYGAQLRVSNWNKNLFLTKKERKRMSCSRLFSHFPSSSELNLLSRKRHK